jgi:hypothetical protein
MINISIIGDDIGNYSFKDTTNNSVYYMWLSSI